MRDLARPISVVLLGVFGMLGCGEPRSAPSREPETAGAGPRPDSPAPTAAAAPVEAAIAAFDRALATGDLTTASAQLRVAERADRARAARLGLRRRLVEAVARAAGPRSLSAAPRVDWASVLAGPGAASHGPDVVARPDASAE